ncbi:cytochrome-c peroxidase [Paraglaciecola sp. MB-3u-78]|uniref:cytochrome-c peroxidase n=1 Tax=Paraglaciecola sp. MB-3u-78 TaxID=2058332 RepID=UPI000C3409F3|nr:cytochrome c peroxidase [Paraglaciecola sp. MB-3u-78]PKH00046.1 cytochrome-c peroxidase [Paraglaciecola sp. MB-3u-78]
MQARYFITLSSALLACGILVFFYYLLPLSDTSSTTARLDTTYQNISVDGPIQPIPTSLTYDVNWAILGKALFHSPLLSGDNTVSCSSCHLVDFGGDDGFPVSTGINNQTGSRNSPTVLNATFNFRQFWDGRSPTLAHQALGPITNPLEMGTSLQSIIQKLKQYDEFRVAFDELSSSGITSENILQALTIYEQTLITPNAPIDQYLLGDNSALTEQQQRGWLKFQQFGCVSCHQGRNIGGNLFQKLGRVDSVPSHLLLDEGRYEITQQEKDRNVFKVPSLRNIALTSPYFHDGSIVSLKEAVKIMARAQLGRQLSDEDVDDLVALLHSFTGIKHELVSNE